MNCKKCGYDNEEKAKFCLNCGNLMNEDFRSQDIVTDYDDTFFRILFGALLFFEIVLGYVLPIIYIIQYFTSNFNFFVYGLGALENQWINNAFRYSIIGGLYSAIVLFFISITKYSQDKKFQLLLCLTIGSGIICYLLLGLSCFAFFESILKGCE